MKRLFVPLFAIVAVVVAAVGIVVALTSPDDEGRCTAACRQRGLLYYEVWAAGGGHAPVCWCYDGSPALVRVRLD